MRIEFVVCHFYDTPCKAPTRLRHDTTERPSNALAKMQGINLLHGQNVLGETDIPDKFLLQVSGGVGRDLKFILLESLRVAEVNKIQPSDTQAFCAVIEEVRKSLGRKVA
jgi:hypothetical protein